MNNPEEAAALAIKAKEQAETLVRKISEAEKHCLFAGNIPDSPYKEWTDHITAAIRLINETWELIDGGGYDPCPMLNTVNDFQNKLTELRDDYYDAHRGHYYQEWKINEHHFLRDFRAAPRVMAFEDERSASEWMTYHNRDSKHDLQSLDPHTVPTQEHQPIRAAELLEAIESKSNFRNQSEQVRQHFQALEESTIQEAKQALSTLSPEQRDKILREMTG